MQMDVRPVPCVGKCTAHSSQIADTNLAVRNQCSYLYVWILEEAFYVQHFDEIMRLDQIGSRGALPRCASPSSRSWLST
jgi:hypothetical protein